MEFTRSEAKAWSQAHLRDFYMCPLTPMTADLTLDEAGLRENIEAYVEMGINGLVVGGFISEGWNMKLADWYRYHEIIADANKGRMDLWTIILDPSVHQALEKMAFVEKLGFSGAEVINPVVQLRTDDEIYDYFKYLTDHSNLAIVLYRTPVSGKVLSLELLKRLAELETIVGVKQGSLNHAETLKLRRELRDDFIVAEPWERFFLDDLRYGGQVIWGELSYIIYGQKRPLMKEYMELARAGKWDEAYRKWAELEAVRDLYDDVFIWEIARTSTYASALAMLKVWYEAIGLKAGPMLPPVRDVASERKEWLRAKLQEVGVI
ncbi:MAG: dihydrodipicolinate synthase family protein [Hydrogenibacillus schlegelii]|uniref:Dihydrodipicolinate synthase family protein n=1 Tax=Hydrogenibacillus schlegelii TaxID=1484 RepID=A0A947G7D6_HYDSH|nr:dihydrodipicolinate synthase family protein [Hydrogenibacillus schlegelii]